MWEVKFPSDNSLKVADDYVHAVDITIPVSRMVEALAEIIDEQVFKHMIAVKRNCGKKAEYSYLGFYICQKHYDLTAQFMPAKHIKKLSRLKKRCRVAVEIKCR